ncbi:MAG: type II toxin-antitoxin system Phd/YefM family antitoxin [Blastocatellia bacterium]
MQKISLEQDIKPLSEFRANAAGFIEQINKTGRPIVLTQNGRGAAVVLGVAEYDALMEKIELLEEISIAEMQMNEGKVTENEEARKQILERLGK